MFLWSGGFGVTGEWPDFGKLKTERDIRFRDARLFKISCQAAPGPASLNLIAVIRIVMLFDFHVALD
jgi:hypothetical protein